MINCIPDSSLYKDNMHLNPKGGKVLGMNIRQKLNSVLNVSENDAQGEDVSSSSQQSNSCSGRQQGRRQFMNNRGMVYMPMPFLQPPWFISQLQQPYNNNQMNQVSIGEDINTKQHRYT